MKRARRSERTSDLRNPAKKELHTKPTFFSTQILSKRSRFALPHAITAAQKAPCSRRGRRFLFCTYWYSHYKLQANSYSYTLFCSVHSHGLSHASRVV